MAWSKVSLVLAWMMALAGAMPAPAAVETSLTPTDDAFVRDKAGQRDTNFDEHADEIRVTAEGFPHGVPVDIGTLRFDLSGLSGTLTSAELRLYNQASPGPGVEVSVYSVADDDWNGAGPGLGDETTITFNLAPAEGSLLDVQSGAGDPAWMVYDGSALSSHVGDQLAGDEKVTFRIKVTSTGFVDIAVFEDRENGGGTGNAPRLVLVGMVRSPIYLPLVIRGDQGE